jgi:oligosaccharide repeat unit polymerase
MNNFEFFGDINNNINLFILILIFSFLLHYFLFKKNVKSILDPYFLAVFSSIFCFADVFFLFLLNKISSYIFLSYLLTQIAFMIGFYSFKSSKNTINRKTQLNTKKNTDVIAFYFFSFLYLSAQLAIYITKGIPLFMESRLETFKDGGGVGVLGRITEVTSIFALYSFFLVVDMNKFRIKDTLKYTISFTIFLTFLLSGSKSNFLIIFYVLWCYIAYAKINGGNYEPYLKLLKKNLKKIIIISILIICAIIYIQSKSVDALDDKINPLLAIVLRFVFSGDIYWYAYPNNLYLTIPSNNGLLALFSDFFGFFRIVKWDQLPEVIGLTFKSYHHPSDVLTGSNARHNVFGLIYFGFLGSLIFSFLLGVIISFVRSRLAFYLKNTFIGGAIFTYLTIKISSLDTDPQLTITYLDNLFFIFPIIFLFYLLLVEFINNKNDEKSF